VSGAQRKRNSHSVRFRVPYINLKRESDIHIRGLGITEEAHAYIYKLFSLHCEINEVLGKLSVGSCKLKYHLNSMMIFIPLVISTLFPVLKNTTLEINNLKRDEICSIGTLNS